MPVHRRRLNRQRSGMWVVGMLSLCIGDGFGGVGIDAGEGSRNSKRKIRKGREEGMSRLAEGGVCVLVRGNVGGWLVVGGG